MDQSRPSSLEQSIIKVISEKSIEEVSEKLIAFLRDKGFKAAYLTYPSSCESVIIIRKGLMKHYLKVETPPGQEYLIKISFVFHEQMVHVKPSLITIIKQFQTKKHSNSGNAFSSFYKLYWVTIVVLGLVLTSLVSVFSWLRRELIEYFGVVGVVGLIVGIGVLVYIALISPLYYSNWRKKVAEKQMREILQILEEFVEQIKNNKKESVTCWNCFKKIEGEREYCPYCGAKL